MVFFCAASSATFSYLRLCTVMPADRDGGGSRCTAATDCSRTQYSTLPGTMRSGPVDTPASSRRVSDAQDGSADRFARTFVWAAARWVTPHPSDTAPAGADATSCSE